jgi:hypothetical protein
LRSCDWRAAPPPSRIDHPDAGHSAHGDGEVEAELATAVPKLGGGPVGLIGDDGDDGAAGQLRSDRTAQHGERKLRLRLEGDCVWNPCFRAPRGVVRPRFWPVELEIERQIRLWGCQCEIDANLAVRDLACSASVLAAAIKITAETAAEAKASVDFYARCGYECIKIYNSVSRRRAQASSA